jgi:EAL domain-containing protein (putative c-di-GMP-specific phosphodiesterase class I)/FixJ family two-component response regulator
MQLHRQSQTGDPQSRLAYVLDDDPDVGLLACEMVADVGLTAQHFQDEIAFLAAVKCAPPDVILLDLALGGTDAVEVLHRLETIKYAGSVALISGRDSQTLAEVREIGLARNLAMLPTLRKPFLREDLAQVFAAEPVRAVAKRRDTSNQLSVDLGEAMEQGWLELWYQAKISLKTLSVCGAEALARVRHPHKGIVLPSQFLPRADHPLHTPLLRFVMRQATRDWVAMAAQGLSLKLSINAPASLLHEVVPFARQMIPTDANFPGLIVEVTEDEVIRDPRFAHEVAVQLGLYGVELSIDDFGAGVASLSRLRDLPFHELKLDRAFVTNCATDARNRAISEAAVKLGHQFGASVCAEGIANADDLKVLRALGFDSGQGYLFGAPAPLASFMQFLLAQRSTAPSGTARPAVGRPAAG